MSGLLTAAYDRAPFFQGDNDTLVDPAASRRLQKKVSDWIHNVEKAVSTL